ncbi:MAG: nucleoside 2-deoxyribosyltransferase [Acidimicrobiia bacterium]
MTDELPAVYLASPLGFSAAGQLWYEQVLVPAVRARGIGVLDPWSGAHQLEAALALPPGRDRERALRVASREIAGANFAMIRASHGVLAVLDGTDVDSGTAAEMGYALAHGKPVFGLRTDVRKTGDHELTLVNLQVEECVFASGGIIDTRLDPVLDALEERVITRPAPRSASEHVVSLLDADAPAPSRTQSGEPGTGPVAWANESHRLGAAAPAPSALTPTATSAPASAYGSADTSTARLGRFTRVGDRT